MNCFKCQSHFDMLKHTPKLLVMCGHSLCELCCYQSYKNGIIECLQCKTNTFTDKISSLPKNLALISDQNANTNICPKHSKKYQAYCSNQKILICIGCILEDGHKNHQINSLSKSFESELSTICKKVQKIQKYLDDVKMKAIQNSQFQSQSQKNYQKAKQTLTQSFNSVRKIIEEQQNSLFLQIQALFQTNQQKSFQQSQNYNQRIYQIQQQISKAKKMLNYPQIEFLYNLRDLQQNIDSIKFNNYENNHPTNFTITKNSIIDSCIKSLANLKNTLTSTTSNNLASNLSQLNNLPPKTNKNGYGVEPIKGFRKAAFSNVGNCQNNKPQKKISSRKQSITHQVQAPNLKNLDKDKVLKTNNSNRTSQLSDYSGQKRTVKKIQIVQRVNIQLSAVDAKQSLCNSFLSNMTSFMSQNRSICILGGFSDENNNILQLDLNSMIYKEISKLNTNRSKFGTVFINKKLYIFGGKRGKQRLNDIQLFDIQKQQAIKIGSMSKSKSGFGITHVDDQIYLIGGNDGQNILNSVQTFNIHTREWKKLPPMNEARDQLAVIIGENQRIYAIGGFGGPNHKPLKSVEYFDIKKKEWKYLAKLNHSRRALSAAVLADGIYAIGGFDGASYMSSVEKYDKNSDQWVQVAPMNIARCTHSSISIYQTQQIFVLGGFDFLPLNSVQKYSPISNQWQIVSQMPSPRFMHSSILLKDFSY